MHQRIGEKRKLRQFGTKLIRSSIIFILSFILITAWFFIFVFKRQSIISPLPKYLSNMAIPSSEETIMSIRSLLKKENFTVDSISSASDSSVIVFGDNGIEVIFSKIKDLAKQVASLQQIKTQLTIEGKRLRLVDFRYENPVVAF